MPVAAARPPWSTPAAAHLRRLGQRQPVAAGAQHRRRYRHPQPDSRSGAGRHRPDRPLGTIDAGEAGIRVSGNVNVAALQVVNAANIQTQGQSSGIPLVASVNTGALTSASAAASSATQAAEDVSRQQQAAARSACRR